MTDDDALSGESQPSNDLGTLVASQEPQCMSDEEEKELEGDDDDDEEEDEEPSLKYERIGGALPDLLKKDSASSLAISNKLLVSTLVSRLFQCCFHHL